METNEAIKRLKEGNERFCARQIYGGDVSFARRAEARDGQKPCAAIVCCSDSRVIPEVIFDAGLGELFVIRTAGNTVGENELASLEYAVDHLGVKTVLILGHTRCGAVDAALHGEFGGAVGVITRKIAAAAGGEKDPTRACMMNIDHGVGTVRDAFSRRGVGVCGALYALESGEVTFTETPFDVRRPL